MSAATTSSTDPVGADPVEPDGGGRALIERRLVALAINILAQYGADALRQRQRFDRQTRQPRVDGLFGKPRSQW